MNPTNNTRKIGIIGGVGPQATQFIYGKIIELSQTKYGAKNNDDYPKILIESVPVPDFISDTSQIEVAKRMLIKSTQSLTSAGATRICIGSNTVHILLEELQKNTEVKFISMIELVAKKCVELGFSKVGLLGTPVLIKSGLYEQEMKKHGIELVLPTENESEIADSIIRDVLAGQKSFDKKQEYIGALNDLFSRGAQTIILGCTELPLAINYEALGNRTISSDEILAEGLVDYYYNSNE
ncbi:MAG: amino acid racemase [Candidatus Roizmanbacteria bacterium]|nr:amino acid racemase [Candidatus Roizmanbacteria bacterium]